MVVTRSTFYPTLAKLKDCALLSLDTETTGLRPYHGDRLFSVILANGEEAFYFNFNPMTDCAPDELLGVVHLKQLGTLFSNPATMWFMHNAKFDLAMLAREGLHLAGTIHCTKTIARVIKNDHSDYSLAACAERIGFKKDETVENYITENRLWEWVSIPGKAQRGKNKHFERVPFAIISKYGETDANITFALGKSQEAAVEDLNDEGTKGLPTLRPLVINERRLTETVFRMEQIGLKIDREYCVRAARYESDRASKARDQFKIETGKILVTSPKLFKEVFKSDFDRWGYTKKGNPSFDSEILKNFLNPAAQCILEYRDAKSRADFYHGFLYHADRNDIIHPNYNSDGARTGRFSSSNPNFQNLTSEEGAEELGKEFVVRRAVVPRPGFLLIMPDYDQMEYRLMLEYAARGVRHITPLIEEVLKGVDVHQATANIAGIDRSTAKTVNFLTLYGGGTKKLMGAIGCTYEKAKEIQNRIFEAAPEIKTLCNSVQDVAIWRNNIHNWFGRRVFYPQADITYRAPNALIQGGCADVVKVAMNRIDEYLLPLKSRMIMTVHDELPIEVHESEVETVPKRVHQIMEEVFPAKYLKLTAGMEYSAKSLADKVKGFPK